jgi:hypothetical protein
MAIHHLPRITENFTAFNFHESSYRSELYAMLAGFLSFKSLSESIGMMPGVKIILTLISDNRPLVNKIYKRLQSKRTTNQHRDSDVDLELQLIYELETWTSDNHQISIGFVRSHQELKKVKSELSHIELLNITADNLTKLARKYKSKATYTSLPKIPVDFTINDITINAKYALRSKKSYHSTHLRSYFQQ